jgi:hypothetical protein
MFKSRKARRWLLIACLLLAFPVISVGHALLHQSQAQQKQSERPAATATPVSPAGPAPTSASQSPVSTGPIAAPTDIAAITTVSKQFVVAAYSFNYYDKPGDVDKRVLPYVTAHFSGYLPEPPSPSSNAGMSYREFHTVAVAGVIGDGVHIAGDSPTSALVSVTVTVITTAEGQSTTQQAFQRVLTVQKVGSRWLVAVLTEG